MMYATCVIGGRFRRFLVLKLNTYTIWVKMAKIKKRFSKPINNYVNLHIKKHNITLEEE